METDIIEEIDRDKVKEIAHGIVNEMIDRLYDEYPIDQEFIVISVKGLEFPNYGEKNDKIIVPALIEYNSEVNNKSQTATLIRCTRFPDIIGEKVRRKIEENSKGKHEQILQDLKKEPRSIGDQHIEDAVFQLDESSGFSIDNIQRVLNMIRTGEELDNNEQENEEIDEEIDEELSQPEPDPDPFSRARQYINSLYPQYRWIGIADRIMLVEHVIEEVPDLSVVMIQSLIDEHNRLTNQNIDETESIRLHVERIICRVCHVENIQDIRYISDEDRRHIQRYVHAELGEHEFIVDRIINNIRYVSNSERRLNTNEAEEISNEDLEAASEVYDRVIENNQPLRGEIPVNTIDNSSDGIIMDDEPDPNEDRAI